MPSPISPAKSTAEPDSQISPAVNPNDLFAYDKSKPLNLKVNTVQEIDRIKVNDISYDSPKIGRVPGYLVVPPGKGPFGGIVYAHWGQGNRSEWLSESIEMAKRGALSVMIDAPFWRPEVRSLPFANHTEAELDAFVQLVIDLRRAVDVLGEQSNVDSKRIGYVGHSLGATWGGPLAVVEKRIRMLVLLAGCSSLTDNDSFYGELQRTSVPEKEFQAYVARMEPYNPGHFLSDTGPAKVYFQWATNDMFVSRRSAKEYYEAVGGPKEEHWYVTGHEFNDGRSSEDRREWLTRELKLSRG